MSRLSYTKALDDLLRPLEFQRQGRDWTRVRGEIEERVDLQKSWVDGSVTVNVWARNLETEKILESIPCYEVLGIIQFGVRIGSLIDGYDRWWKNDPTGPVELAEATRIHAIPWFDKVRSLEDQASKWYGRGTTRPWSSPNLGALAVTLYRLGEIAEALAMFDAPVPKTANSTIVARGRCVQRWLEAQVHQT